MMGQQKDSKVKKQQSKKTVKKTTGKSKAVKLPKISKKKKTNENEVKSTKRKPTVKKDEQTHHTEQFAEVNRPTLLLQYLYFLNSNANKYIAIGLSPENDFRPTIVLASSMSHVVFSVPDWIALFCNYMYEPINQWFDGDESTENQCLIQKNYKISNFKSEDTRLILIENIPQNRLNNSMFLTQEEYRQCIGMDSYVQPLIKQMQTNSNIIRDYFDLYVGYCFCKKKSQLDDDEFFMPFDNTLNLDTYRVFKEIPLICENKIKADLTLMEEYAFE